MISAAFLKLKYEIEDGISETTKCEIKYAEFYISAAGSVSISSKLPAYEKELKKELSHLQLPTSYLKSFFNSSHSDSSTL